MDTQTEKPNTVLTVLYANMDTERGQEAFGDEPRGLRFTMTETLATKIRQLAVVAKTHDLYAAELFDYSPEWLNGESENVESPQEIAHASCRISYAMLKVGKDEFWYETMVKHSDTVMTSSRIPLSALSQS